VRGVFATALGLLLATTGHAGGDEWDAVRASRIDPLNSTLHSHLPSMLKARKLDVVVGFYATRTGTGLTWSAEPEVEGTGGPLALRWRARGEESIRERYEQLLDRFSEIDRVDLRIDRVDWEIETPLGHPAQVRLLVRGWAPDRRRLQLEQHAILHVRFYDPHWEITAEEITSRILVSSPRPGFEWESNGVGISNLHANDASPPFHLFGGPEDNPVRQGSGVGVSDVDRDGCEDLLLGGSPELVLYRNRCDGTFEDVTLAAGLPRPYPAAASGILFLDYDNDGWSDLFVTGVQGGDRLFRNESGQFTDVTAQAGIPQATWGSMAAAADYDRDGHLDIYVARMGDHEHDVPTPSHDARNGKRGTLLRNVGDGTFRDVTSKAGVGSRGWDFAATWGDYDDDGWPDLYVANEFGGNALYHNRGDGTFTDESEASGTVDGGSSMGAAWGDVDGDGDLDLFVSGMKANSGWAMLHPTFPAPVPWHARLVGAFFPKRVRARTEEIIHELTRGSSLYRNDGDGTFTDVSELAGVRDAQWAWGAQFVDYDNDGGLDLYVVNGFISGPILDDR
jgi:hypothetical protein